MTKIATTPANGGETHQRAGGEDAVLTTNHGVPISDNQNSQKSGARGPTLLEDFVLREKIFHFDHERIPERIVHARGSGAHGLFEATDDISDLSSAAVFSKGEKTGVGIILSDEGGQALLKEGAAVEFAMNTFAHFKAIGVNKGAQPLLDKAGVEPDEGVTGLDGAFIKAAARCFYDREPKLRTLA